MSLPVEAAESTVARRKRLGFQLAITAGALLLTALYALGVSPYWSISPDSVDYVESAQNLAAGRSYGASIRPPVPSILFAIPLALAPDSYLGLNAVNTALYLASALAAYLLFRPVLGSGAGLLALLLLGSNLVLQWSTVPLADSAYLLFSLLALSLHSSAPGGEDRGRRARRAAWVAATLTLACMSRVIGLALVLAIVADQALLLARTRTRPLARPLLALAAALALAVVAGWEIRNHATSISMFDLALQREIWVPDQGHVSPLDMVTRLLRNLRSYGWIGDIVANQLPHHAPILGEPLRSALSLACFAFCAYGFALRCRLGVSVIELYTVIYLMAIGLFENDVFLRWFIPITPFLLYYAIVAFAELRRAAGSPGHAAARIALPVLPIGVALYLAAFFGSTLAYGRPLIREAHHSEIPSQGIKYARNYDLQRLALSLSQWAEPEDSYLCLHPGVLQKFTRQQAYVVPFSEEPEDLIERMTETGSRYVLTDKTKPMIRRFVLPAIRAREDRFEVVRDEPGALLVRLRPAGGDPRPEP